MHVTGTSSSWKYILLLIVNLLFTPCSPKFLVHKLLLIKIWTKELQMRMSMRENTVWNQSICQSWVTAIPKSTKCHRGHTKFDKKTTKCVSWDPKQLTNTPQYRNLTKPNFCQTSHRSHNLTNWLISDSIQKLINHQVTDCEKKSTTFVLDGTSLKSRNSHNQIRADPMVNTWWRLWIRKTTKARKRDHEEKYKGLR